MRKSWIQRCHIFSFFWLKILSGWHSEDFLSCLGFPDVWQHDQSYCTGVTTGLPRVKISWDILTDLHMHRSCWLLEKARLTAQTRQTLYTQLLRYLQTRIYSVLSDLEGGWFFSCTSCGFIWNSLRIYFCQPILHLRIDRIIQVGSDFQRSSRPTFYSKQSSLQVRAGYSWPCPATFWKYL